MIQVSPVENSRTEPELTASPSSPAQPNDPLLHLLVQVDDPWYVSLRQQIHDVFYPPKLPPLVTTSKPAEVKDIWGEYRYGRVSRLSSILVHVIVIAIIVIPFGRKPWSMPRL